ncbi:MAG: hypothetical protein P1P84_24525 [Deferrisomatales bacterium]|nr:hypothetical protein [Deferrisomatales bacterium]
MGPLCLLLFLGLELCHPAADLLHFNAHLGCEEHNAAEHSSNAAENPTVDTHGPFVLVSAPGFQLPVPGRWALLLRAQRPESLVLPVPSPVPICGSV